jgi:hypothetical protein
LKRHDEEVARKALEDAKQEAAARRSKAGPHPLASLPGAARSPFGQDEEEAAETAALSPYALKKKAEQRARERGRVLEERLGTRR